MKYATLYVTHDAWHGLPASADAGAFDGARGGDDGLELSGLDGWRATLGRGQTVRLVLSAASVPMACTPWTASVASAAALRREVEAGWGQRLGAEHGHSIRIHWPRHGMPLVSLAWPPQVCERLQAQLGPHRIVEANCSVFAGLDDGAGTRSGRSLLLFGEDDGYCALHMLGGEPVGVEQLPLDGSGLDAMPVWMRRKQLDYPEDGAIRWIASSHGVAPQMREVLA